MLTTDFSGTYDWPVEEAKAEAEYWIEIIKEETDKDYLKRAIGKLAAHWEKVFDNADDMEAFSNTFNSLMPSQDYYI